jgi:hypothetical protein
MGLGDGLSGCPPLLSDGVFGGVVAPGDSKPVSEVFINQCENNTSAMPNAEISNPTDADTKTRTARSRRASTA